jgi:hypothetical protein
MVFGLRLSIHRAASFVIPSSVSCPVLLQINRVNYFVPKILSFFIVRLYFINTTKMGLSSLPPRQLLVATMLQAHDCAIGSTGIRSGSPVDESWSAAPC